MHILNTIFYLVIAISLIISKYFPDIGLFTCILTCILGLIVSVFGFINDSFLKPKRKLRERVKRIEDEKNNLMSDLEKEAKRKRDMDHYQQN